MSREPIAASVLVMLIGAISSRVGTVGVPTASVVHSLMPPLPDQWRHRMRRAGRSFRCGPTAGADAGVARLVYVSTAGVYDRSAGIWDVAEDGDLLPVGSGDHPD